jgi:hypothetical protein
MLELPGMEANCGQDSLNSLNAAENTLKPARRTAR